MIKKIILKLVHLVTVYLTVLLPRSKRTLVFGSWYGNQFGDNPMHLFLRMQKDSRFKVYWITKNQKIRDSLLARGLPVLMSDSLKGMAVQLRSKYFVTATDIYDVGCHLLGGAIHIELWHGIPIKKIGHDDEISNHLGPMTKLYYNLFRFPLSRRYLFSTSPTVSKIYQSAFREKRERILELGQPRCDLFFEPPEENEAISKLTKKGTRKVILYMPTTRNGGKTRLDLDKRFDFDALNKFCDQANCAFLIKKHYCHLGETIDLSRYSNIFDISDTKIDIQQLLKASDVLVTDYSSCFIDYLLLDRPILFFCYDWDEYQRSDRQLYFELEEIAPGPISRTFASLMDDLKKSVLEGLDPDREKRTASLDLFYSPATRKAVSETIVNDIFLGNR